MEAPARGVQLYQPLGFLGQPVQSQCEGSAHGYIHCSLSRLAIAPELTKEPLELKLLHRVCRREAAGPQATRASIEADPWD